RIADRVLPDAVISEEIESLRRRGGRQHAPAQGRDDLLRDDPLDRLSQSSAHGFPARLPFAGCSIRAGASCWIRRWHSRQADDTSRLAFDSTRIGRLRLGSTYFGWWSPY